MLPSGAVSAAEAYQLQLLVRAAANKLAVKWLNLQPKKMLNYSSNVTCLITSSRY